MKYPCSCLNSRNGSALSLHFEQAGPIADKCSSHRGLLHLIGALITVLDIIGFRGSNLLFGGIFPPLVSVDVVSMCLSINSSG